MAGQQPPFDGLVFLACSGAKTFNVRSNREIKPLPSRQPGEKYTQVKHYQKRLALKHFKPRLVVISLGGNDAGFGTIGLMCVAPGKCDELHGLWDSDHSLGQVKAALDETYKEVASIFPRTPVVAIPYPEPIATYRLADSINRLKKCAQISLSASERKFIALFVRKLNQQVHVAATVHGFYYLGAMQHALADSHLQLCDSQNNGQPGVNFIGLRSVNGIAEQRFNPARWAHNSLHPNEQGHAAMLRVFQRWLVTHPDLLGPSERLSTQQDVKTEIGSIHPTKPTGSAVGVPQPPCDLFDVVSPSGCRPQGQRWAMQQVGAFVLRWGWIVLVVVLSAGLFGVAFFGWRRDRRSWAIKG